MPERQHIGLVRNSTSFRKPIFLSLLLLLPLLAIFAPTTSTVLLVLALNTLIETNKRFIPFVPVDIEILYAGVLFLATHLNPLAAFSLALAGPLVAEFAHLRSSREVLSRTPGLLLSAGLATLVPASFVWLLLALGSGLCLQYLIAARLYDTYGAQNLLRRLSTFVMCVAVLRLLF